MRKTTRFDAADYLDTEERQVAYITAALETGDADFVRDALGLVARARGMGQIAKNAGLNRESLYKALGETGNPEFSTVMRIVRALGSDTFCASRGDRTNVQQLRRTQKPSTHGLALLNRQDAARRRARGRRAPPPDAEESGSDWLAAAMDARAELEAGAM